jgi:dihydroflavonol-4-reductase
MVVLITGITGLVGSAIARKFLDNGHQIKALVRKNANENNIADFKNQIEIVEGDILDIFSIDTALVGVDYVVHSAAMVSYAPKDKEKMFKTNIEGTTNIVNACLLQNIKKLCFISSIASLGKPSNILDNTNQSIGIDETHKWEDSDLNSNYAKTKYLAENEVWRAAAEGLNTVIINPSVILGEGNWHNSSLQLFKYVHNLKPFYTLGSLNYVDVTDVAEICYSLTLSDIINERYVISAGIISYKQLFDQIAKRFKVKSPNIFVKPWLINIIWRWEAIKSFITGYAPLITKETAKTAQTKIIYKNDKIKKQLNFEFKTLDNTLNRVCTYFLSHNK